MPRTPKASAGDKTPVSRKLPPTSKPGIRVEDPKKAYTIHQLAEVGAVVLIGNQIDSFVDWLLNSALRAPDSLFWEIGRRMRLEAKLDILRERAARSHIFNDDARSCIKVSLDAISEYNKYRNRIAHSVPYYPDIRIASMANHKAALFQVLVTKDTLSALYLKLSLLLTELKEIDVLYRLAEQHAEERDPVARGRLRDVFAQIVRVRETQKARLSLPPLPMFPVEPEVPPMERPVP